MRSVLGKIYKALLSRAPPCLHKNAVATALSLVLDSGSKIVDGSFELLPIFLCFPFCREAVTILRDGEYLPGWGFPLSNKGLFPD